MAEKPGTGGRMLRPLVFDRSESPPKQKKRKTSIQKDEEPSTCIQSLPPELLEEILIKASVGDVISFGATCSAFHELSLSPSLWRRLCQHQNIRPPQPSPGLTTDWRRTAILKFTQALHMYRLGGGPRTRYRFGVPSVSHAAIPPLALGFKRALPTQEQLILGDQQGTVFMLRNSMTLDHGHMAWRRASRHSVLCRNAKDFAVDSRSDSNSSQYVYVLVGKPHTEGHVEVYNRDTCQRVQKMTFHPTLRFTQLRLTGTTVNRSLLLLTSTGKVYSLSVNESQFNMHRSYTIQLSLKTMTSWLPHLPIAQIHASCRSCLYLTAEGSVYLEVSTSGVHRQLFGSQRGFDPQHLNPVLLSLPYKVVKCSLGLSHLCLLDDCGRVYMQGSNRYGQLGTGDKIDRGQPTRVELSMAPVEFFCGLNHSLALLQGESGEKEVHGCGCGGGGRLPGWSKGSAVFVRLSVGGVPRAARSLWSSKYCLFLLSCHDVAEAPLFRWPPPRVTEGDEEERERERLRGQLARMKECESRHGQIHLLNEAVQSHMTLRSTHRHFLEEALSIIHHGSDRPTES